LQENNAQLAAEFVYLQHQSAEQARASDPEAARSTIIWGEESE
jgi:hypothetical protein